MRQTPIRISAPMDLSLDPAFHPSRFTINEIRLTEACMVKISEQLRVFRVTARWVRLIIVRRRRVRRSKPTCFQPKPHLE
jgi:hypothetical protein